MKTRKKKRQLDSARLRNGLRWPMPRAGSPDIDPRVVRRIDKHRVPVEKLRWSCDPREFEFRTTREIRRTRPFLGQSKALQTLKMGLSMAGPGFNLFVCGLAGTQKITRIEEFVRSASKAPEKVPDRVYAANFADPQRPRLLLFQPGQGHRFEEDIAQLLSSIHDRLDGVPPHRWRSLTRETVDKAFPRLLKNYPDPDVHDWLRQWRKVLLQQIRSVLIEDFEVNSLGQPALGAGPRVCVETQPSHANLFGWIGRRTIGDQSVQPHFTVIRRGSYLEADGGVLIIDAYDLYNSPGVWTTLKNTLKYGKLEIQDGDPSSPARTGIIKPEPIDLNVKIILVGDYSLYDYLFEADPDFQEIFKIRVDFATETQLTRPVLKRDFPAFVAGICQGENLRPVTSTGMAKIVEFAVRTGGRKNKICSQSNLIADLLREADYWAGVSGRRTIKADDVDRARREAVDRVNQLEQKISEMISEGTILISTSGSRVGQVNGLAIYDMGDYFFGKPSRITCETSVGQGGIINIERESGFSGRSHDKGVQILGGYLRSKFAQNRPMSLTASVCFEQSYSGIDGDSASSTEIYAILSSLANAPIRQDLAVTGSLSQKGDIQPIGGVNEKIEGFFDCVNANRPTGFEGVIIPAKNVPDLMLRQDIVTAVERGTFHIFAIDNITQGIEILTGIAAGRSFKNGTHTPGSVFDRVDKRLEELANSLRRYGEGGDEE